jgi:DUF2911 family protein
MVARCTPFALLLTVALMVSVSAGSAPALQRASPHESTSGSIGGADPTITYGSPYMRGRTIMGALVPYGRVWCPGADEATTLTTTRPITIGDLDLDAGRYTLWMLPSVDAWEMIVNRQTGQWHTQYDASKDIGRVPLEKATLKTPVEQLTFAIEKDPSGSSGAIVMRWETTEVRARIQVK